jgi:hypothetical protein
LTAIEQAITPHAGNATSMPYFLSLDAWRR